MRDFYSDTIYSDTCILDIANDIKTKSQKTIPNEGQIT